jgi:integral membrane protein
MPTRPLRVPPTRDFPTIRRSLLFYKTFAYATGVALLLLCVEIIGRYVFGVELELGGPYGFLALVPPTQLHAVNLSATIQYVHGYLYLVYLISDFVLITVMRYPITRFLVIAAGGVVPFLSFVTERRVHAEVTGYLAEREAAEREQATTRV